MKIVGIMLRAVLKNLVSRKMPFKFSDVFRSSPTSLGKSSEFQRKKFCTGIKNFPPYSRRFKASFKSIKKNRFSENYTVVALKRG